MRAKTRYGRTMFSFSISFVPLLMVLGLLAPVFGPAIDHHYVDRSPAHAHVFVGEETNLHEHLLASHDHSDENLGISGNGDGISITSTSANSVYGSLALDGATLETKVPSYADHMIALQIRESLVPDDEAIAPLDRPPRRV
ncbi:hypothetical protein JYU04_03465 [Dehalococcoides mccartyi]|nr:hypothetical protein [Dehalococcoides mccartyi]